MCRFSFFLLFFLLFLMIWQLTVDRWDDSGLGIFLNCWNLKHSLTVGLYIVSLLPLSSFLFPVYYTALYLWWNSPETLSYLTDNGVVIFICFFCAQQKPNRFIHPHQMAQKKRRKWKTQENRRTWCEIPKVQREFKYTHWFQGRKFKNKKSNLFFFNFSSPSCFQWCEQKWKYQRICLFFAFSFFRHYFPSSSF